MYSEQRQFIRSVLAGDRCLSPATVYDALSARVAESVGYRLGILAGLAEGHEEVRDPLPRHARVLLELLVQQPERLRALHGRDGILPDAHFRMKDESVLLMSTDQVSTEIVNSDEPLAFLGRFGTARKVY